MSTQVIESSKKSLILGKSGLSFGY